MHPDQKLKRYQLNTIKYGTTSSISFSATRRLEQIAKEQESQLPAINNFIRHHLLTGTTMVDEAREIKRQISETLADAGLQLRNFLSNDPRVLEQHVEQRICCAIPQIRMM